MIANKHATLVARIKVWHLIRLVQSSKADDTDEQRARRQQRHPPREVGQRAAGHVTEVEHKHEQNGEPARAQGVGDRVGNVERGIGLSTETR